MYILCFTGWAFPSQNWKNMVRGHDHPSKTDSYGFHPPFWLLKSCSILISGWQIDQVPQFFSSNPICLIILGCNFPIFTGLFTFFGVNLCFFTSFGRFLRSLQPHISPGRRRRWRRRGQEPRPAIAVTIFNRWPMVMIRKSWVIYGGFQKWLVYVDGKSY